MTRKDVEGDGEHLELVFADDGEEEKTDATTVVANRTYGTMAGKKVFG